MSSLVGWARELATMERFLVAEPSPRALLIEGVAGAGKTTLLRAGVRAADKGGLRLLECAPAEPESSLPFAALGDLLRPHVEDVLPQLSRPQHRALATALLLDDVAGDERVTPHAVAAALHSTLAYLAAEQPVLVAVDDVQWLDPASADALAYALRRIENAEPVRVLIARRSTVETVGAAAPLGLDRAFEGRLEHLVPQPLNADETYALVRAQLDVILSPPELARVHGLSGGNPFHALELARAVAGGPRGSGSERELPPTLGGLVQGRLRHLPAATREALAACAVMAMPTIRLVGEVFDAADAWELVAPAVDGGVLAVEDGVIRFTHPLLAASARAGVRPSERRRLHARLADLAPSPDERARHLVRCHAPPDEGVAVELEAGARAAMRRGATALAAELADEALRFGLPGDEGLVSRTLRACDALHAAGRDDRAEALVDAAAARLPRGPLRARMLVERASWSAPAAARPLLEQVLDEADGEPTTTCAAWVQIAWCHYDEDWQAAGAAVARALPLADVAEPQIAARAYVTAAQIAQYRGEPGAFDLLQRAAAFEQRCGAMLPEDHSPGVQVALLAVFADHLDEGRRLLLEQLPRAEAAGEESVVASIQFRLAQVEWAAGRWSAAAAAMEHVTRHDEQAGVEDLAVLGTWLASLIAVSRGGGSEERAALAKGAEECARLGFAVWARLHRWVLGFLELSLGRPREALVQLDGLAAEWQRAGGVEQGFTHYASDELEALILVGRDEDAERRIAEEEARAAYLDRPRLHGVAARARGMLASRRGDHDEAVRQLQTAVAIHAAGELPFDHGRSLLALGCAQRRAGRRRDAGGSLEAALSIFDALGARHWSEPARAEAARLGGRRSAGDELSPTEHHVAALVAGGRTNREVASELVVSIRAVEANLTRIYAKLGVRSRVELAARYRR